MVKLMRSRNCLGLEKIKARLEVSKNLLNSVRSMTENFQVLGSKKLFFKGETGDFQITGVYPGEQLTLLIKREDKREEIIESFEKLLERGE